MIERIHRRTWTRLRIDTRGRNAESRPGETERPLIALTMAILLGGCSFVLTSGPQSSGSSPQVYPDCTPAMNWPIADAALSAIMLATGLNAEFGSSTEPPTAPPTAPPAEPGSPEGGSGGIAEMSVFSAVFAASAYLGYSRVSRCRKARARFYTAHPGFNPQYPELAPPAQPDPPSSLTQLPSPAQQLESHIGVRSPMEPAPAEAQPLDLTVRVRAERDGQRWGVAVGDTLKTGDFLELFVHLNQPAYVYVVQALPDGTFAELYPNDGDRLLSGGREHRIPDNADESFQLGPQDKEENIYILMSRAPIVQASALLSTPDPPTSCAGDKRLESPSYNPPDRDRKAADSGSAHPRRTDRVLSITTRRVVRVKRPDGTLTIIDAAESRDKPALIVRLYFKHA